MKTPPKDTVYLQLDVPKPKEILSIVIKISQFATSKVNNKHIFSVGESISQIHNNNTETLNDPQNNNILLQYILVVSMLVNIYYYFEF